MCGPQNYSTHCPLHLWRPCVHLGYNFGKQSFLKSRATPGNLGQYLITKQPQPRKRTTAVHSAIQYPLNVKSGCFGGTAILSVYSKPSSITPASYFLTSGVMYKRTPELSTMPANNETKRIRSCFVRQHLCGNA